ncbi:Uma2 family endonuclease, partial [Myxococcus llanfairpwllgwyngyllgogerychwyrndrobwllllantysiliogogogochensis]
TYEDIEALPVGWVGEIVEDLLYASPRPVPRHLRVASRLGALLAMPFELVPGGPGGWWFLDGPELHLGRDVLVPDLAGWRRERVPEPPHDVPWLTQAPDWVCEVLSPSTEKADRFRKLPVYHRAGVRHAWLIDPARRSLEVFHHGAGGWAPGARHEGDVIARVEPFEAVTLALDLLWLPRREAERGERTPSTR